MVIDALCNVHVSSRRMLHSLLVLLLSPEQRNQMKDISRWIRHTQHPHQRRAVPSDTKPKHFPSRLVFLSSCLSPSLPHWFSRSGVTNVRLPALTLLSPRHDVTSLAACLCVCACDSFQSSRRPARGESERKMRNKHANTGRESEPN